MVKIPHESHSLQKVQKQQSNILLIMLLSKTEFDTMDKAEIKPELDRNQDEVYPLYH